MTFRFSAPSVLATFAYVQLSLGTARADCVDGTRAASPSEIDFATRGFGALAAALPAPIANSERRGAPPEIGKAPALSFCKGQREGDFTVAVAQGYLYRFPKADADRMFAERKDDWRAGSGGHPFSDASRNTSAPVLALLRGPRRAPLRVLG